MTSASILSISHLKSDRGISGGHDSDQQGKGTVVQLHDHAIQDAHALGNVQQVQDDLLVGAQHIALGHHVQQRVGDLPGSAGDNDTDWLGLGERGME